jgi:two-component system sensor histidine kinase KdpD
LCWGLIEPHGRFETEALVSGLERVPLKGSNTAVDLYELDLEAILARRLKSWWDELAHTNVPGSKHQKRYEDALEIDSGISVITAVNQHMESSMTPWRITGVQVREAVPDLLQARE